MRRTVTAVVLAAALSGCGASSTGGQLSSQGGGTTDVSPQPEGPTAPSAGSSCVSAPPVAESTSGTTDLTKKPQVEVPDSPPPCNLVVGDIVKGTGAEAKAGDPVTMKYVGVLYSTGKQFDASWDRGQDFPFQLGGGQVIPGWDQGIVGMKVGGRRQLVIPPDLAYGPQGSPPTIPPGATLIFVVDLVKVG